MIPYTVIKEANRPEHSGTATGVINFLNFSLTALLGPLFASRLMAASGGGERELGALPGDLHAAALRRRARDRADAPAARNRPEGAQASAKLTAPAELRSRTEFQRRTSMSTTVLEPKHKTTTEERRARSSPACGRRKSTSATSSSTITSPITATRASSPGRPSGRSAIWKKLTDLFVEERKKGVLDVSQIPSTITAHDAGYIDKKNEVIVGLQTDAPLKRAIMPKLSENLLNSGKSSKAEKWIKKTQESKSTILDGNFQARLYLRTGRFDEAKKLLYLSKRK